MKGHKEPDAADKMFSERLRPGNFARSLPSSEQGQIFKTAATILEERQEEKGFENDGIIDMSQGDPASEPIGEVIEEMAQQAKFLPFGKYRFSVTSMPYLVSSLRYLVKHGVNYNTLVSNTPDDFYKDPKKVAQSLEIIDELLFDEDLKGKNLFLAHYYHNVADEQHEPVYSDGQTYKKQELIDELMATNIYLNLQEASEKLQMLVGAIKDLNIIGGTQNCKAALANCVSMFAGKYVLSPSGIYQAFSDTPSDRDKSWEIIDTTDTPHYKITARHLQKWMDDNPEKVADINSLVLADPSNPAGGVYSESELRELVDFCCTHRIPIIVDSVYRGIEIKDGVVSTPITELYPKGAIAFKSMGKVFSSPALRVGFTYGNPEFIQRFNALTRNETGFLPTPSDIGAAAIMEYTPEDYFKINNKLYKERVAFVKKRVSEINENLQEKFGDTVDPKQFIELNDPQGGYFILVNMPFLKGVHFPYDCPSTKEKKVGVVEGSMDITRMFIHFDNEEAKAEGVRLPPTTSQALPDSLMQVRISVGRDKIPLLEEGLSRIEKVILGTLTRQAELKVLYERQEQTAKLDKAV